MTTRRKFTEEFKSEICAQALNPQSIKELACMHNLQPSQIYKWLKTEETKTNQDSNIISFKTPENKRIKELEALIEDLTEDRNKLAKIVDALLIEPHNNLNKRISAI